MTDTPPRRARAVGIATWSTKGDGTKVLDTWYPVLAVDDEAGPADATIAAAGVDASATATTVVDTAALRKAAAEAGDDLLAALADGVERPGSGLPVRRAAVVTVIDDLAAAPVDTHDVYLRLHLLSSRRVRPRGLSLDGQFGLLNTVVWTSHGPADPDGFEADRAALLARGERIEVQGLDKFPRMTDYVVPTGVRIADASRVRLGAHLADGTTVMHEGFVNFNAGTVGNAMVEGRISAGVIVGVDTDLGGGSSLMGTLSGGGKQVVSVGERCLVGANAGVGIALGDDCVVEAGLYVTAGTKLVLVEGDERREIKAAELSGASGVLYRRNSLTGAVEALPRTGEGISLNAALHA